MTFIKTNWVALVAVVIAIFAAFHFSAPIKFGAVDTTCQGYTTCLSDLYLSTSWGGTGAFRAAGTLIVDGITTLTGAATANGLVTENAGVLYSSPNSTTTTATAQTLKVSDVQGYDTVILTPNVGSDTVTFFASSTASTWLPAAGDSQRTCFINGTTTSAINLTFAGGTGTTLLVASSSATALGSLVIGPQKKGCFDFTRGNATATTFDIIASFISYL